MNGFAITMGVLCILVAVGATLLVHHALKGPKL